jgi:hypothetical protein
MLPNPKIQFFHVFENRMSNLWKGFSTNHPFATIAVEHIPHQPATIDTKEYRLSIAVCSTKDRFSRKTGARRAVGLLNTDDRHVAYFTRAEIAHFNFHQILERLNAKHIIVKNHLWIDYERACQSLRNVAVDIRGDRFNEKGETVPRSSRAEDRNWKGDQSLAITCTFFG